jgi:hypothetical protein
MTPDDVRSGDVDIAIVLLIAVSAMVLLYLSRVM